MTYRLVSHNFNLVCFNFDLQTRFTKAWFFFFCGDNRLPCGYASVYAVLNLPWQGKINYFLPEMWISCYKRSQTSFYPLKQTNSSTSVVWFTNKWFIWTDSSKRLSITQQLTHWFVLCGTSVWLTLVSANSWWCNVCFICWSGCSMTYLSGGQMMSWRPFDLRTQIWLTRSVRSISMCYEQPSVTPVFYLFSVTYVLHIKPG